MEQKLQGEGREVVFEEYYGGLLILRKYWTMLRDDWTWRLYGSGRRPNPIWECRGKLSEEAAATPSSSRSSGHSPPVPWWAHHP